MDANIVAFQLNGAGRVGRLSRAEDQAAFDIHCGFDGRRARRTSLPATRSIGGSEHQLSYLGENL
jgi:hypothetical protein